MKDQVLYAAAARMVSAFAAGLQAFMSPAAVDVMTAELTREVRTALRKDPKARLRIEVAFHPFEFDYEFLSGSGDDDDNGTISMGGVFGRF